MAGTASNDGFPAEQLSVTQGFGFSIEPTDTSVIQSTLDQSQQLVDALRSIINQHVTSQVAESAVTHTMLSEPIHAKVQSDLTSAAQSELALHGPIQQRVMQPLSMALEATIPMGVIPPSPGSSPTDPACVLLKQAAISGDVTAISEYYRANGGGMGYPLSVNAIKARQTIQDCANGVVGAHVWILKLLDAIDSSLPSTALGGAPPAVQIKPAIPPDGVSSGGAPPAIQSQPTTKPAVFVPQPVPGVKIPQPPGCLTGTPFIHDARVPIPGFDLSIDPCNPTPNGIAPTCNTLQALGYNAINQWIQNVAPHGGIVGYHSALGESNDPNAPVLRMTVTPVFSITDGTWTGKLIFNSENPVYPGFGGGGECDIPLPGVEPPPPEPKPAPCPPQQPTCGPVNVVVNCADKCKPSEKPPETKPPEKKPADCKYSLYCTSGGIVYAVKGDEPPRETADTLLAAGDPKEWMIYDIASKCGKKSSGSTPSEGYGGGVVAAPIEIPGCSEFALGVAVSSPTGGFNLSQLLGVRNSSGNIDWPYPDASATDVGARMANGLTELVAGLADNITAALQPILGLSCGGYGAGTTLTITRGILGFLEQWLGVKLDSLTIPNDQQRHYICPTVLPTEAEAMSAYLGGQIDVGTLECWVRANNKRFPEYSRYIDSQRSKLSANEMAVALRRRLVSNELYGEYVRQSGYIRDYEAQLIYDLTKQIPGPSDLVRFMVRDAADEQLVKQFRLDDEFDQKFAGKLKEWAADQGVDDEYMKYVWRSHWSIPAPGQLYEMLHRLTRLPAGDPGHVDPQDIRTALVQQDIAPFWIDKFLAISYRPLSRIDARRAYEIGALDQDGLKNAYLDLGYAPAQAQTLVDFNRKNVIRTFMRRPEIKELAAGDISEPEYSSLMDMFGADEEIKQKGREYAQYLRSKNRRIACRKSIRKRYLTGDMSYDEVIKALDGLSISGAAARDIAESWKCELTLRGKTFSASQAGALFADGVIDVGKYYSMLQNVGYDQDQAALLIRQQQYRLGIKADRDQAALMRRQEADQQRQQRQIQQIQRQAEQQQRRAAAAAQKMQATKLAREKRLIEAGHNYSKHVGVSVPDGVIAVKSIYNAILRTMTVTQDEAIQSLLLATADKNLTTDSDVRQATVSGLTIQE